jgi:hypothetical protein
MLCDVISAVAELMVRKLWLSPSIGVHNVGGGKPRLQQMVWSAGHLCGAISAPAVEEFMIDVTGVETPASTDGLVRVE